MNLTRNCPGFLCSILLTQPLIWVFVVLAIVAALAAVTKRHDVMGYGSGAIRARYGQPMIHRKGVKQPRRTAAYSATAAEVVKGKLPIIFGKVAWKASLASNIPMKNGEKFTLVLFGVLLSALPLSFWVFRFPLPGLGGAIRVLFLYQSLPLTLFFEIPRSPISTGLTPSLLVCLAPLLVILAFLFWIAGSLSLGISTRLTSGAQGRRVTSLFLVKVFGRRWLEFFTNGATLKRLIHQAFSCCVSCKYQSGQVTGETFRYADQASLAHRQFIIPQETVVG